MAEDKKSNLTLADVNVPKSGGGQPTPPVADDEGPTAEQKGKAPAIPPPPQDEGASKDVGRKVIANGDTPTSSTNSYQNLLRTAMLHPVVERISNDRSQMSLDSTYWEGEDHNMTLREYLEHKKNKTLSQSLSSMRAHAASMAREALARKVIPFPSTFQPTEETNPKMGYGRERNLQALAAAGVKFKTGAARVAIPGLTALHDVVFMGIEDQVRDLNICKTSQCDLALTPRVAPGVLEKKPEVSYAYFPTYHPNYKLIDFDHSFLGFVRAQAATNKDVRAMYQSFCQKVQESYLGSGCAAGQVGRLISCHAIAEKSLKTIRHMGAKAFYNREGIMTALDRVLGDRSCDVDGEEKMYLDISYRCAFYLHCSDEDVHSMAQTTLHDIFPQGLPTDAKRLPVGLAHKSCTAGLVYDSEDQDKIWPQLLFNTCALFSTIDNWARKHKKDADIHGEFHKLLQFCQWMKTCMLKEKVELYARSDFDEKVRNYFPTNICCQWLAELLLKPFFTEPSPISTQLLGPRGWKTASKCLLHFAPVHGGVQVLLANMVREAARNGIAMCVYADNLYMVLRTTKRSGPLPDRIIGLLANGDPFLIKTMQLYNFQWFSFDGQKMEASHTFPLERIFCEWLARAYGAKTAGFAYEEEKTGGPRTRFSRKSRLSLTWSLILRELVPWMAVDIIGTWYQDQIVVPGLSTGVQGTALFNTMAMARVQDTLAQMWEEPARFMKKDFWEGDTKVSVEDLVKKRQTKSPVALKPRPLLFELEASGLKQHEFFPFTSVETGKAASLGPALRYACAVNAVWLTMESRVGTNKVDLLAVLEQGAIAHLDLLGFDAVMVTSPTRDTMSAVVPMLSYDRWLGSCCFHKFAKSTKENDKDPAPYWGLSYVKYKALWILGGWFYPQGPAVRAYAEMCLDRFVSFSGAHLSGEIKDAQVGESIPDLVLNILYGEAHLTETDIAFGAISSACRKARIPSLADVFSVLADAEFAETWKAVDGTGVSSSTSSSTPGGKQDDETEDDAKEFFRPSKLGIPKVPVAPFVGEERVTPPMSTPASSSSFVPLGGTTIDPTLPSGRPAPVSKTSPAGLARLRYEKGPVVTAIKNRLMGWISSKRPVVLRKRQGWNESWTANRPSVWAAFEDEVTRACTDIGATKEIVVAALHDVDMKEQLKLKLFNLDAINAVGQQVPLWKLAAGQIGGNFQSPEDLHRHWAVQSHHSHPKKVPTKRKGHVT